MCVSNRNEWMYAEDTGAGSLVIFVPVRALPMNGRLKSWRGALFWSDDAFRTAVLFGGKLLRI